MSDALFNHPTAVIEGWYWACRSHEIGRGRIKAVRMLGRDLAIFRGADGRVTALDAYCAHMGAHLAEGRVEGNQVRCFFHHWRYDRDGRCNHIPCLEGTPPAAARVRSWPTAEHYGLVWVWTGERPAHDVPEVPELSGRKVTAWLSNRFTKRCHPSVVLVNAIDEQHFHSVHHLPGSILHMQAMPRSASNIEFHNTGRLPADRWSGRLLGRFYRSALTYRLSYWYGSMGFVTLGPDFLHLHVMFAMRRGEDGEALGQTVALTQHRRGPLGWLVSKAVLLITVLAARYFARGDTRVFETIRFDLRTPIPADRAVLAFMRHLEQQQPAAHWTDESAAAARPDRRLRAAGHRDTHG